jgi:phosphatidylserine/phosphatidylglycerophosphate/cardiolipin synthase-like enzyme
MIVDSSVVVVGGQNWSPQGVAQNRDASLIIHNAAAAKYWEQIFNHDWTSMADFASQD